MSETRPLLSIMIPAYNEEENVRLMHEALCQETGPELGVDCEFLFIDDGSTDKTFAVLEELHAQDPRVKILRLSRNFGSHTGVSVGLDFASGDAAIIIACDLQDHPREIRRFLEKWREGYHVVWGVRSSRGDKLRDVFFSRLFAKLMRRIAIPEYPANGTGSFCLMDRKVMDALRRFPEHNRMTFGLILQTGFSQVQMSYERGERQSGVSKYSLGRKIKVLIDAVVSFSTTPIRMATLSGMGLAALSIFYALYAALSYFVWGNPVPGYTSTIVIMLLLGGVQLTVLGVLGEYIWRILDDVRRRPLYLIWETRGVFPAPGVLRDQCPQPGRRGVE